MHNFLIQPCLESKWYTPFSVNRNWHAYRNPWMRF